MYHALGVVSPGGRSCAPCDDFFSGTNNRSKCKTACNAAHDQTQCDTYCIPAFSGNNNRDDCISACNTSFVLAGQWVLPGGALLPPPSSPYSAYRPLPTSQDGSTPPLPSFLDSIPTWVKIAAVAAGAFFLLKRRS